MKRIFSIISIILLMGLLLVAFFLQKEVLPEQIRKVQTNLNVPSRYAFITDGHSPVLAVFDTYNQSIIEKIPLKTTADLVSVSRQGGYLAYTKRGSTTLHLLNLETFDETTIELVAGIEAVKVHAQGQWIAYTTAKAVIIMDKKGKLIKRIPASGEVALTYGADGSRLLIAELQRGLIHEYQFAETTLNTRVDLDETVISPVSIMPDGRALFFNAKRGHETVLYRYAFTDNSLSIVQLPRSPLLLRPYITNDNRTILVLANGDKQLAEVIALDADNFDVSATYAVGRLPRKLSPTADLLRTGWLEQVIIVAGEKAIYSFDTLGDGNYQTTSLPGQVIDMIVQSDSKTMLSTVSQSTALWVFDMRQQAMKSHTVLNLTQPDTVIMGQTNTLCH